MERDGNVNASRFCAGCHDVVPFFSGAFNDPDYDMLDDPTAHAGITCTACHAITNINSPRGNSDYTIDVPIHYPFTFSDNPALQWVNEQLVKAKPEFHKKTFLKPLHKTTEFCGTCHKVHLPEELNGYKWLRGQNHQDAFWLSGVSGHGVQQLLLSGTAPSRTATVATCPPIASDDFGARVRDDSGVTKTLDHLLPFGEHGGSVQLAVGERAPDGGAGATAALAAHRSLQRRRRARRPVRHQGGRPHRRGARRRRCGPEVPALRPGRDLPPRDRHPHRQDGARASPRAPRTPTSSGWTSRSRVGRARRSDAAEGWTPRAGAVDPVVALRQLVHARPRRQPHQPPQRPGHLHAALLEPDPAGRRGRRPLPARGARADVHRARSRSRCGCATASSTRSTCASSRDDPDWSQRPARSSSWPRTGSRSRSASRRRRPVDARRSDDSRGSAGTTTGSASCASAVRASCARPSTPSSRSRRWADPTAR